MKIQKNMMIVGAILLVAVVAIIAAGLQQPAQKSEEVKYGGQYYPEEFVMKGMVPAPWAKYGLGVEQTLFSSGSEGNKALISGDVDINVGSDSKTVQLFSAIPDDALIIATVQSGNRYSTIVRKDSPYKSWEDLKGKRVATKFGTGAEMVLRKYYSENGMSWDDFDYVNMPIEDMISALKSGQIEAFTAWEPTPSVAEVDGVGKTLMSYGDVALTPVQIHTTKGYAKTHRKEIVEFLAGCIDASKLIKNSPKEAAKLAADAAAKEGVNLSPEAFERMFKKIDFSVKLNKGLVDEISKTGEFLKSQGKLDDVPKLAWDSSYLDEAKKLSST